MNAKPSALDTYLVRTATIHAKFGLLQQLDDDHFGHDSDAINWGHVGDLGRVDAALDDLLAKVVAALLNPDGATIFQLMCCTGWQPHTIQGALSGTVRKKLWLNVASNKAAGGKRVTRIAWRVIA